MLTSAVAATVLTAAVHVGCVFQPVLPVTRADLAESYLEFERALRDSPPADDRWASLNRDFDRATVSFFSGQYGRAIEQIDRMTATLHPPRGAPGESAVAASLKVEFQPPIRVTGRPEPVTVTIGSLYPVDAGEARTAPMTLRLTPPSGAAIDAPLPLRVGPMTRIDETATLAADDARMPVGSYEVQLVGSDGTAYRIGRWSVVERSLEQVRSANESRLSSLTPASAAMTQALAICRARNELLSDEPSELDSAQFLIDPNRHAAELEAEIRALCEGRNPYERRVGDLWRVLPGGASPVPFRFFAPEVVAHEPQRRLPLIVAFHGAGGDEQMFMDGYGAGSIKALAARREFLLAAPLSTPFLRDPAVFDRLIDSLKLDYAIDEERIGVLGHSLGAGVAAMLALQRPDRIAAACCMAGGMVGEQAERIAPSLWIAGALDTVVPIARIERSAERAVRRGLALEFRRIEDFGHTLIVGRYLPDALTFLLDRRAAGSEATGR